VERLPNDIDIGNGIRIKQSDSGRLPREHTPITLPDEAAAREAILDRVLLERLADYFSSHTLEFKIPIGGDETAQEEGKPPPCTLPKKTCLCCRAQERGWGRLRRRRRRRQGGKEGGQERRHDAPHDDVPDESGDDGGHSPQVRRTDSFQSSSGG
jgi:hypothetical protein